MQTTTTLRSPAPRHSFAWLLAALWLGLAPTPAEAVNCYSAALTGDWNAASTWSSASGGNPVTNPCAGPSNYPGATDTAYIENAHTVTVNGTFAAASVIVNASASNNTTTTLAVSSGSLSVGSLLVPGNVTLNGGTGNRNAQVSISTGTLTVTGNLTPSGASAMVTFTGAGFITIGGHFANGATYAAGTGTVTYNGSAGQNVGAYNYYNLTINKSNIATLLGNVTIGNNLSLSAGTLDIGINSINRGAVGGTLTLADTTTLQIASASFPANYATETINAGSTVEYNGSANINVPAKAYGHLTLSGSNNANRNLPALTIAGNLTTSGSVAARAEGNLTINGTTGINIGSGTSFDASTFSHTVKGNFANSGTFTRGTSTFTFSGSAAQTISSAAAFHHLVINNTATTPSVTPGATLSISGNFTNTAGFTAATNNNTTTFNGTAAQSLTGITTFHNLIMNNTAGLTTAGLTLNSNVTVNNTLAFTSGKITTGGTTTPPAPYLYTLTTGGATSTCAANTSVTGAGQTTGWVVGNLKKYVPANTICAFEVGGTNYYSPITDVSFASVTTAGYITGAAMPYSPDGHPNITGTDINKDINVNRFWTLKDPTAVFASYNATFNFDTADLDAGADQLEFVIRRYDPPHPGAGTWSNVTVNEATITSTSIQGTGITGTGDFAIGNSSISAFLREREWVYQRELYYDP